MRVSSLAPWCLTKAVPARTLTDTMAELTSQAIVCPCGRWHSHSPPPSGAPCFCDSRSREALDRCCHTSLLANRSRWGVGSELEALNQQIAMSPRYESGTQQSGLSCGKSCSNGCTSSREAANLAGHIFALPESFESHHRQRPDPKGQGCSHGRMAFQALEAGTPDSHHTLPT